MKDNVLDEKFAEDFNSTARYLKKPITMKKLIEIKKKLDHIEKENKNG